MLGVCAELLLVNKSVLQLNCYFLLLLLPRSTRTFFSIHSTTIFKTLQKSFYRCVSPVFWWMVFPNFICRQPFFFIIILHDNFVFFFSYTKINFRHVLFGPLGICHYLTYSNWYFLMIQTAIFPTPNWHQTDSNKYFWTVFNPNLTNKPIFNHSETLMNF